MNMVGTINPETDYKDIAEGVTLVQDTVNYLTKRGCRIEIPTNYRYWEYGSAVQLVIEYSKDTKVPKKILNVGSGWDGLSPTISMHCKNAQVTECEPDPVCRADREKVNTILSEKETFTNIKILPTGLEDLPKDKFDLVFCISVLEHTNNERQCWLNLTKSVKSGGVLFVTTDCMPVLGKPYTWDNLRVTNYSPEMLKERVEMIVNQGFKTIGTPDYIYHGNYVADYTFFRAGFIKD